MTNYRFIKRLQMLMILIALGTNSPARTELEPEGNQAVRYDKSPYTIDEKFVTYNKNKFILRCKFETLRAGDVVQKALAGKLFGDETQTIIPAYQKYLKGMSKYSEQLPQKLHNYNFVTIGCKSVGSHTFENGARVFTTYLYYLTRTISKPLENAETDLPTEIRGFIVCDEKNDKVLTIADFLTPETIKAMGLDGESTDMMITPNGELVCYTTKICDDEKSKRIMLATSNMTMFTDNVKELLKANEANNDNNHISKANDIARINAFEVVEVMPSFPGGDVEMMKWLSKNIKYPEIAEKNGVQGRVIVKFIVDKDGSIHEPKVLRSIDPSLDREALRVISSMPRWIPGKANGVAVAVYFTMPVTFQLQ